MALQIIVFYLLGLVMFILGVERKDEGNTTSLHFIYLGIAFFVNLIGYYISYSDSDYVITAYLPLVMIMLTIVFLLYYGIEALKLKTSDEYSENEN